MQRSHDSGNSLIVGARIGIDVDVSHRPGLKAARDRRIQVFWRPHPAGIDISLTVISNRYHKSVVLIDAWHRYGVLGLCGSYADSMEISYRHDHIREHEHDKQHNQD